MGTKRAFGNPATHVPTPSPAWLRSRRAKSVASVHRFLLPLLHLGLVAIDSPVVTYRDPKHGSQDPDEALDETVKDRFYTWLADRKEDGQIIVLENEEPDPAVRTQLGCTEFIGTGEVGGRRGFFPG